MLTIYTCLVDQHDWRLVAAAVAICVLGCFVSAALWETLDRKKDVRRAFWIGISAITAASSVWATHFVAMLAYDVRLEQGLSLPLTALSFLLAIVLMVPASIAFGRAHRDRRWAAPAGAAFVVAVAVMHYTGMRAYGTGAWLAWDASLVVVSILAGAVLSVAAGFVFASGQSWLARIAMPVLLALGIASLHFTGMASVTVTPFSSFPQGGDITGADWLPFATIAAVVVLLSGAAWALWQDRTELRQRTVEMRIARDRAQSETQAKSRFLAKMSHELRTPLNGVLGLTQALRQTPLNDDQRELVGTILSSGSALVAIVDDILDAARLDAKGIVLDPAPFDLGFLVEDVARLMGEEARAKELHLGTSVAPELSDPVIGDAKRIRQILLNLVGNAIKFTATGEVRIEAVRAPDGDTILLSVTDTGIGIAADRQDDIFNAFTQADDSTTRRFGGTGLGLTICRELARLMGGDIHVESRPGAGSTFRVALCLPGAPASCTAAVASPTDAVSPAISSRNCHRSDPRSGRARVLVVDDVKLNRVVVRRLLPTDLFVTEEAENGRLACDALARSRDEGRPFDVILMDVSMPVMDGLAATAAIRKIERTGDVGDTPVRIVGLTAHAAPEDSQRCRKAGMDEVLVKPAKREELLAALGSSEAAASALADGSSLAGRARLDGGDAATTGL